MYITLQTLLFRGTPVKTYRLLYLGALLSYSIVVVKSLGKPTGAAWLRRAFVDENAQYALLAFYWWDFVNARQLTQAHLQAH